MSRIFFALLAATWVLCLPAKELLEIKGDYLLYSYDFNTIYGQGNIQFHCKEWTIHAGLLEIDVAGRTALAGRGCRVEAGGKEYNADLLEIDLESLSLRFTIFKETVQSWTLPGERRRRAGAPAQTDAAVSKPFVSRGLEVLKKSLVYYLNQRIVISTLYRVYGYQSTVFIEGVQSLSFKKFNLDRGMDTNQLQGIWIDRFWYYASQGLVANTHFLLEKPVKSGTAKSFNVLDIKYDPFNNIEYGPALRLNFNSQNSFSLTRKLEVALNVNFLTENLFQTEIAFRSQWTPQWRSELAAEYSLSADRREELWLRFRSNLQNKKLGTVALNLGYEKKKQYQGDFSLRNQTVKNLQVSLQHSFSRLLFGDGTYNRQSQSNVSLSYTQRLFQMAADYSFHRDLLQDQSQGTPRFTLNAMPFRLYNGLLQVNFASSFLVNRLTLGGKRDDQKRANLMFNLQSEPLRLGDRSTLTMALSAEQLLDQERTNQFTSLGCILKCTQSLARFADLDFLYNFNSRRRTEAWLIQGTTSQDWSAVLRLKDKGQRVQGWASLSYDTKAGRFTNSYLDCAVSLIKNWQCQTQMNYDFMFKNFNYELYLIRHAGRIMLRVSYRSLSKQILLEILPR